MTHLSAVKVKSITMILGFVVSVAVAVLVPATPSLAQYADPVMTQIDRDYQSWVEHLKAQYRQGIITQSEYWRQTDVLEANIQRRRATRQAEVAEIQRKRDLEERQVRAMEQMANQPVGPYEMTCERSWSNPRQMTCR